MANFKALSRTEWSGESTPENINAGSLQRIADACEKMAGNWYSLTSDRDRYKGWYEQERAKNATLNNRIRSLRGAVTKAKKNTGEVAPC